MGRQAAWVLGVCVMVSGCEKRALMTGGADGGGGDAAVLVDAMPDAAVAADASPEAPVTVDATPEVALMADAALDAGDARGDAGPLACGAFTCSNGDICIVKNFCGGPVMCVAATGPGTCPTGYLFTQTCPATGNPGCVPTCSPSYVCMPPPVSCAGALSCACLPAAFCVPGTCVIAAGRTVTCANQ
jgi:hypothetical protein